MLEIIGRGAQIWTGDFLLPKQARYQAALRPDWYRMNFWWIGGAIDPDNRLAELNPQENGTVIDPIQVRNSSAPKGLNPDEPEITNYKHQITNKFQITVSNLEKNQKPIVWSAYVCALVF